MEVHSDALHVLTWMSGDAYMFPHFDLDFVSEGKIVRLAQYVDSRSWQLSKQ